MRGIGHEIDGYIGANAARLQERIRELDEECYALALDCKSLEDDREYNARLVEERDVTICKLKKEINALRGALMVCKDALDHPEQKSQLAWAAIEKAEDALRMGE